MGNGNAYTTAAKSLLAQLSGVMRAAARLILVLPRQSHVTSEIRARLHWLDMPSRVQFKLCCLTFQCLHGFAPRIWRATSLQSAQMRDANSHSFNQLPPGYFSSHVPGLWGLAPGVRGPSPLPRGTVFRPVFVIPSSVISVFRKKLKTYLFNITTWLSSLIIQLLIIYS